MTDWLREWLSEGHIRLQSGFSSKKSTEVSIICTVCPGSSDPLEKISNIFASENEAYTIF